VSWSFVGSVTTGNVVSGTTGTISLPAGTNGGDLIVVACCFYNTTFTQASFTTQQNSSGSQGAKDAFWLGTRIAGGTAGSGTTDSTFTITFGATTWGEWVVSVYRATNGVGSVVGSAEYHTSSGYVTACPDATYTPTAGNLNVWGYAGQNSTVGTTATTFSGTAPTALTNFVQQGTTGNGGGVGFGWKTTSGSPGGATANQAVDPTDFALEAQEAAGGSVTGSPQPQPGSPLFRRRFRPVQQYPLVPVIPVTVANAGLASGTGSVPALTVASAGLATGTGTATTTNPAFTNVTAFFDPVVTSKQFTLAPTAVGDFILAAILCPTTNADWATALSSAGGNVLWSSIGSPAHLASSVNTATAALFIGQVITAASHTVTITTNTGSPTLRMLGSEFNCANGFSAVTVDASGTEDVSSSGHFPAVTPTRTGDLYWSACYDFGSGSTGTTAGYTYEVDANGNVLCFNISCPNSTQTPNIGNTDGITGIGIMLYSAGTFASAGLATGTGTAQPPGLAQAALAAGTGTAQPPSAPGPFLAGLASGTGTAPPFGLAQAALAHGTGTVTQAALAQAALAAGTGAASSLTVAPAGLATGTGTAQPGQFFAAAQLAHATGTASQSPSKAGLATAAGTAQAPSAPGPVAAGLAHGTGTALSTSSPNAGLAHGTGTAGPPPFPAPLNHFAVAFTEPGPSAVLSGNSFGGTLAVPNFGAALTPAVNLGAALTLANLSAALAAPGLGATLVLPAFGAAVTGGTMQQASLTLSEFNDMTVNIAVTNNGVAFNLTGYNLNLLLKSAAGVPDSSALTFSSTGGSPAITITSPSGGLAVAQLPNADLDAETYSFYRLDVVQTSTSYQQTTVYGPITWITL
jgi:hypothetical protein